MDEGEHLAIITINAIASERILKVVVTLRLFTSAETAAASHG